MKKPILLAIIFLFVIFLARTSYSLAATPTPPQVTPTPADTEGAFLSEPGQNPGPPIGIPCGKTMCLGGEICIQFPGDVDEHCVPEELVPEEFLPPTPSISPTPSPTPGPPKIPRAPLPEKCAEGTGIFPPSSTCYNDVMETQKDPKNFEKTCIYQPVVQYSDTRFYDSREQPFTECGKGVFPGTGEVGPGGDNPDCDVALLINTDVKEAELGSYGPSVPADDYYSSDFLAQNYLYNALFDRPLDLSDTNREAYRTYWRLMPASNQANLRSFIMNMTNNGKLDNIKFNFKDKNGDPQDTSFQELYDALKKQIIFFWHFPFFRIGCLVQYPVCPEYATAQETLIPDFVYIKDAIKDLDFGAFDALVDTALAAYETFIKLPPFNGDLSAPYAAFVPLDHTSVRSYILKKKDEKEDNAYKDFEYFRPLPFYHLTNVSFEYVPYVGAIYQGLLSPKFGMLPALQPSWIVDKYSTPSAGAISDYKMGNYPQDLPEVKIAKRNFLEVVVEETEAFFSNPFGWISEVVRDFFTDEDKKKGYIPGEEDFYDNKDRIAEIREVYDNPVGCPLPVSYHVLAPKTAAKSIDDHHQVVLIPGKQLAWSYNPESRDLCRMVGPKGAEVLDCSCRGKGAYVEGDQCITPKWSVEATKDAKALNVLNNPKQIDIRETIASNDQYAFYDMMLPEGVKNDIPPANIDAPIAKHIMQEARGGNKPDGKVKNPLEPINRISNLAQDSMHYLQNCWTVPSKLQNSPRCELIFPDEASAEALEACGEVNDTEVNQKYLGAFKTNFVDLANRWTASCQGEDNNLADECYNFVVSEAQKGGINPAFALTIWLNESGASNYCFGGPTTQDMGINLSALYKNLQEQIKVFITMAKQELCKGVPGFVENMHGWLSRYQSSRGVCDATDPVATQYYYDVMNATWDFVSGCPAGGKFGISWPTDMSCP